LFFFIGWGMSGANKSPTYVSLSAFFAFLAFFGSGMISKAICAQASASAMLSNVLAFNVYWLL